MNTYELLYIVGTQFTDTEVEGVRDVVVKMIEKEGGSVSRTENLGKIKLAYPIKGMRHGTYILVHVESEPEAINKIERSLRLSDEVLRHQIIELPADAKNREYKINAYVAPLSDEARPARRGEGKSESASEASAEPAEKKPVAAAASTPAISEDVKPAMSMEELDQKLDKILDGDVTETV